jgi:WD40 repeat protein
LPNKKGAVSVTADGDAIIWSDRSLNDLSKNLERGDKAAVKIVRLHNGPINHISIAKNKYIITGGEEGYIKIYDLNVMLLKERFYF